MAKIIVKKGERFGRLIVIKEVNKLIGRRAFKLKCDCGNIKVTTLKRLKNGNCSSCGCLQKEVASKAKKIHGYTKHQLYSIWNSMKSRCYNENRDNYDFYGGRGRAALATSDRSDMIKHCLLKLVAWYLRRQPNNTALVGQYLTHGLNYDYIVLMGDAEYDEYQSCQRKLYQE